MSSDSKNYELAYLLSPSLSQEEVLTQAGKLTTLIEESKGMIRKVEEPRKRTLAYPIKKQSSAFFGWTTFSMAPEFTPGLEKKLRGQEQLLRFTLVEEEEITTRPFMLRTVPSRPQPSYPRPIPREAPKTDEKLDLEALDKKLEEILGK